MSLTFTLNLGFSVVHVSKNNEKYFQINYTFWYINIYLVTIFCNKFFCTLKEKKVLQSPLKFNNELDRPYRKFKKFTNLKTKCDIIANHSCSLIMSLVSNLPSYVPFTYVPFTYADSLNISPKLNCV